MQGTAATHATPSAMAEATIAETTNALRTFTHFFGPAPYSRIAITQQPQFNFGQSWPGLIYLPVSAFLDSTTRWMMIGQSAFGFADFIQVVTPHEVAHQWWGHIVGWSSYHDQWISEGIAEFSAYLYLQNTEKNRKKWIEFWAKHRQAILEKTRDGLQPNDAGPVWMGLRVNQFKAPRAYNQLVYPKGAFVIHMLRQMMWDEKTGDATFIAMMKEFVQVNRDKNATTESFSNVISRHMRPDMNLGGDSSMLWFVYQWLLTTDLPRYELRYRFEQGERGSVVLTGRVHQSGVSDKFRMRVPVFVELDGQVIRALSVPVMGNTASPQFRAMLPKKPGRVMLNYYHDVLATESVAREQPPEP
jgi:aminopeptidase N